MGPYSEAIKNVMEAGRKEGLKLLGIPFGCGTEGWKDKDAAREFVLGLKLFLEEVSQEDTGIEVSFLILIYSFIVIDSDFSCLFILIITGNYHFWHLI